MRKYLILANNDVGLYKFRKELIKKLLNDNVEVHIALPSGSSINKLTSMGCIFHEIDIDRRGMNISKDIYLIFQYYNLIKKNRFDYVITYTIKPNIYGGFISSLIKTPYITNITGLGTAFHKRNWLLYIIVYLYKVALKNAKVVFFENDGNRNQFVTSGIVSHERAIKLNGAGVDTDMFKYVEYPPNSFIRFLFIGRIMKEKGIDEFLYVAEKICNEYEGVVFDIIGPMEDDYIKTIEECQLKGSINYHGYQEDVRPFIKQSHCFILPSYHEGMANTLLENGAMGRPLITTNIHGCKEAVIDEKTGYIVMVKSGEDLLKKVIQFIKLSYEEKLQMGLNSHLHIKDKFEKNSVVNMTLEVMKNAITS